jgi:transcriptional regulator with XRE-family HTH domain
MGSEKETPHLIECGVVPQSTETEIAEGTMVIGNRLRESREAKELSQGDIEKRTGLLRCCISRVENNHTVPAVDTLEKLARALEIPMYQLFHVRRLPMYRTEC